MIKQKKKPYYESARESLSLYHEERIISYKDIMDGIKKYISYYPNLYEINGSLKLNDDAEIIATKQDGDYEYTILDDMFVLPTHVLLKFWEKYATPDQICKDVIQWYFEKYQTGYTLTFKN